METNKHPKKSIYCSSCRFLLGMDRCMTKDESETVRRCKCLSGVGRKIYHQKIFDNPKDSRRRK